MTSSETETWPARAPDGKVLDTFERRMLEIWTRDGFGLDDPVGTARLVRLLLEREGFAPTADVLVESGARADWNRVFAQERSRFVAAWLAPHLRGPVLDVLGGDFTVLSTLVRHGLDPASVTGCERIGAYDLDWARLPFPVFDVPADLQLSEGPFESALLCTVLHHEVDVVALVDAVNRTSARRWVVVENCLDADNDEAFHMFVDEFFNRCLNQFSVPCVPEHRTAPEWRSLLGRYGEVTVEETRTDVPGIPFPYTLFVVER